MDEKVIEITRVAEMVNQLDETQIVLEGMAYDILNCSDSIKNAALKVMETLKMAGVLDITQENQTIIEMYNCLEELSTYTEDMSMCAHYNEEFSSKQHEVVEDIKGALEYYYNKLSNS